MAEVFKTPAVTNKLQVLSLGRVLFEVLRSGLTLITNNVDTYVRFSFLTAEAAQSRMLCMKDLHNRH